MLKTLLALLVIATSPAVANAHDSAEHNAVPRDEWIALGVRVHGGFGAFIPIGIRIGLDALERLKASPRDLAVVYLDSDQSPCACIADGIMIATAASPGQRTLQISPDKAPEGALAVAIIRHKHTGEAVRYVVAQSWMAKIVAWNKAFDPTGRYEAVMNAEGVFEVTPVR